MVIRALARDQDTTGVYGAAAAASFAFVLVGMVAASSGGFFATTWGWSAALTFALAAATLLLRSSTEVSRAELTLLCATVAFTLWSAASTIWSLSVTDTMHEVQRDLAYVGVISAAIVVVRRQAVSALLAGTLAAISVVATYGLATRLFPGRLVNFDSTSFDYRLSPPITYWNGLGIFCVLGVLLALGYAARARTLAARALAAGVLPILATTIYFTFSRGAWYALVLALLATLLIDPRRLQMVAVTTALAPWSLLAIAEVHRQSGLVTAGSTLVEAAQGGHAALPVITGLAVVSGFVAAGFGIAERSIALPQVIRVLFATIILVALVSGSVVTWVVKGSPAQIGRHAWASFNRAPTGGGPDVESRLFSLSANGRVELWRVAAREFRAAPIVGKGAGTFEQSWVRYRPAPINASHAHNLYLGALDELGVVGFVGLLVLIGTPLVSGLRGRRAPIAPFACGAFLAWAAHSGIDWDWNLPGVTIPALLAGVALCKAGPSAEHRWVRARYALASIALLLSLFTAYVMIGDLRIDRARADVRLRPAQALLSAKSAEQFAPWSSEPPAASAAAYLVLGRKQDSRRQLEIAVARDPTRWSLWRDLATVTTGSDRRRALRVARNLNPFFVGR